MTQPDMKVYSSLKNIPKFQYLPNARMRYTKTSLLELMQRIRNGCC